MSIFKLFTDIGVCEHRYCEKVRKLYTVTRKGQTLHLCNSCANVTEPYKLKSKKRNLKLKQTRNIRAGRFTADK